MAGPLGEAVLQLRADATATQEGVHTAFVEEADKPIETIKAAQGIVEGIEGPLAVVVEEVGKLTTALAAGKEEIGSVSSQQSASVEAAGALKQSAERILGDSPSQAAANALSYLRGAEGEIGQAKPPLQAVSNRMDETIGMASELTLAVDMAAAILAKLKQKLDTMYHPSVIIGEHAWRARDHTQIAVHSMDDYLGSIE